MPEVSLISNQCSFLLILVLIWQQKIGINTVIVAAVVANYSLVSRGH